MHRSSSIWVIALTAALVGLRAPARADRALGGTLGPGPDPGPPPSSAQRAKCRRGDAAACFAIGHWHDAQPTGRRTAVGYYERACELPPVKRGQPRLGCTEASSAYRMKRGASKSDRARVRRLSKLGCDSGDGLACWQLAAEELDGTDAGRRRHRAIIVRGCRMEYMPTCENYGVPRPRGR